MKGVLAAIEHKDLIGWNLVCPACAGLVIMRVG